MSFRRRQEARLLVRFYANVRGPLTRALEMTRVQFPPQSYIFHLSHCHKGLPHLSKMYATLIVVYSNV
jgi:hypothetical protein